MAGSSKELPAISVSDEPHAGCDAEAGSDSRQDGYDCLNDEFPSFLLHAFEFL